MKFISKIILALILAVSVTCFASEPISSSEQIVNKIESDTGIMSPWGSIETAYLISMSSRPGEPSAETYKRMVNEYNNKHIDIKSDPFMLFTIIIFITFCALFVSFIVFSIISSIAYKKNKVVKMKIYEKEDKLVR